MLRWLTRLFRQREAAEAAPAEAPPPPAPPTAVAEPTTSEFIATSETPDSLEAPAAEGVALMNAEPEKEICPTCGRTSVFAGPPGQRFCTYCALRGELFEASAAASE